MNNKNLQLFKHKIERLADKFKNESSFFKLAKQGDISKLTIAYYLFNLYSHVNETPLLMKKAIKKAEEMNLDITKEFFVERYPEEKDHYLWAINDLTNLGLVEKKDMYSKVDKKMDKILVKLHNFAENNPNLYVGYQLFSEYITVLVAPILVDVLQKNCNVEESSLSVLTNHVESDQYHYKDDLDYLDKIFVDDLSTQTLLKEMDIIMNLFYEFVEGLIDFENKIASRIVA